MARALISMQIVISWLVRSLIANKGPPLVERRAPPTKRGYFFPIRRFGISSSVWPSQFHLQAPEHLQGAGLVGHVFLRDLSLGEIPCRWNRPLFLLRIAQTMPDLGQCGAIARPLGAGGT